MKKFKSFLMRSVYLSIACLALIITGCSDDPVNNNDNDNTPPDEFVSIASHTAGQHQYTIYALDSLKTGHNEIYINVENNQEEAVEIEDPVVTPLMHMADMMHSAPVSEVETVEKKGRTYLMAEVYFTMASMGSDYWALKIEGETEDGAAIAEEIRVGVAGGGMQVKKKVNDRTYILSYVAPKAPVVGGDRYEVALHYQKSMMEFPAVTGAELMIDPFMDMGEGKGHGPTSVEKIAEEQGAGHYSGEIVYNMSGEWQLTFTATLEDGTEIAFSTFEIMVEQ